LANGEYYAGVAQYADGDAFDGIALDRVSDDTRQHPWLHRTRIREEQSLALSENGIVPAPG
jgi:hypothetical protein